MKIIHNLLFCNQQLGPLREMAELELWGKVPQMQLIVEQQRFELWGSTYVQINTYSSVHVFSFLFFLKLGMMSF